MNGFFLTHALRRAMSQCHLSVQKKSLFNSMSFVLWSCRTIRSVLSTITVTHHKYSPAADRAVSMIKQSASSLTFFIPGILASFNTK